MSRTRLPDGPPAPRKRSPGLIAWGAVIGVISIAGVIAGLAFRPMRDIGALGIFTAVGGAMLIRRGLHGPRGNSGSDSGDGDFADGDGNGDGGGDSSD